MVICAFGYLGDNEKAIADFSESKKIIDTNYTAAISMLNIAAQVFEQKKEGVIVGISSVAGDRGRDSNFIYGSAKAAFTTYLSGLRNKLCNSNVHVLTVKPGFVRTKMTAHLQLPPKLTASAEEVAKAIIKGVEKKKNTIYVLPLWRHIMKVIKNIPEPVFKKLKL